MKNKNIIRIALVTALILLVPLVAMRFTAEVNWTWSDFAVAGVLLFGSGLTYELLARKAGNGAYRAALGVAVATALLLVWVNLAVGIIGSEDNPVNLMYFGVIAVGIAGAAIARLRPHGMAHALFATACAQALVPVAALLIGGSAARALREPPGLLGVLALNTFFVMLFAVSALLFRRSMQGRADKGAQADRGGARLIEGGAMWVFNKGWWGTWVILLAPGVVALAIGIVNPSARTDDNMSLRMFGIVWIVLQLLILGSIFAFMNRQKQRAVYFQKNGIPGTATILAAATTGTMVNDMPQIELKLEIEAPGADRYTIIDRRCWNPLSLAGLQKGAKLPVLVDPRSPKKIMFRDDEQA